MLPRSACALLVSCAAAAADFTLADAIERGLGESGKGVAVHATLAREGDAAAFEVVVAEGQKARRFVLDANDGKLLRTEAVNIDYSTNVELCEVSLRAAVVAALERVPGVARSARILTVNDDWAEVSVSILAERPTHVSIDALTGKARRVLPFTDTFRVAPDEWAATGWNPFLVLEPGHVLVLEGGKEKLTIAILDETRVVDGVTTRVVEERREVAGALATVARRYLAISKRTNDVYCFGAEIVVHERGEARRHEGSWVAGEKGARFGLLMPGTPLEGARYFQGIAPKVALDRAEVFAVSMPCETPAGTFPDCLVIDESGLGRGRVRKWYAPGIGLVRHGDLRLAKESR